MSKIEIKVTGDKEFKALLKKINQKLPAIAMRTVYRLADAITTEYQATVPVRTGRTRDSARWGASFESALTKIEAQVTIGYGAPYLEYGTRRMRARRIAAQAVARTRPKIGREFQTAWREIMGSELGSGR